MVFQVSEWSRSRLLPLAASRVEGVGFWVFGFRVEALGLGFRAWSTSGVYSPFASCIFIPQPLDASCSSASYALPIGSLVVLFCGWHSGSYKVIPKRDY